MKVKNLIAGIILNSIGLSLAFAGNNNMPCAKSRQMHQQARIYDGVKSGELTKKEALNLEIQQANIQQAKKNAKADGFVTPYEKAKIACKQDKASATIYIQKHDAQARP